MTTYATPYPPTGQPMVDGNGYVTRVWSAFFDSFFQNSGVVPIGVVLEFAGLQAPLGFLLCDGASYPTKDYPDLYSAISNSFGGDTSNFNVPDRRGKFAQGAINAGDLGQTGGQDDFTITIDYLPNTAITITDGGHTHPFTPVPHNHALTDPGHTHTTATGGGAGALGGGALSGAGITGNSPTGITIAPASAGGTIDNAVTGITAVLPGSGKSFSLKPPYIFMNYIIKY